jgi:hypothetical protein
MKNGFIPLRIEDLVIPYFSNSSEYRYNFKIVELVPREYQSDIEGQSDTKKVDDMKSTLVQDQWISGCYALETLGENSWRWCGKSASFAFKNYANIAVYVTFNFDVQTGSEKLSNFNIKGRSITEFIKINSNNSKIHGSIKVQPGETYMIEIYSDADPVIAPADPRKLNLRINNFSYTKSTSK